MSGLLPDDELLLGDPWFLALLLPLVVCIVWRLSRRRRGADGASGHVLAGVPGTLRARTTTTAGLNQLLSDR